MPAARAAHADPIEVVVPGAAAGGFRSRTSTDDAPREALDVASVIESQPGVHVRRLGGDESFSTLSIRGAASSEVGVVLAGIPLTGAADPTLDLASLPLWSGAGLRVYRSFAPATIGTAGYLGGVLVLDPPSLARGARTESWAAVGSWGARKLRLADARKIGDVTLATAIAASRADGDFSYFQEDPALPGGGAMRTRENDGHAAASGIERAEVDVGWGTVGATLLGQVREQGLAGSAQYPTTVARLDTSRLAAAADALVRTGDPEREDGVGVGALRLAAYGIEERSAFRDPRGEIDPARPGARTNDAIDVAGASLSWRGIAARGLVLDGVVDGRGEAYRPGGADTFVTSPPATRHALGVGGDVEWKTGGAVTLGATARGDFRSDRVEGSDATTDVVPTGHLGVDVALSRGLSLAAHGGAVARPPSFVELYGDRGALLGNAALRPERATTIDAGARGHVRDGALRVRYELVGFYTVARDLIAFVPYGRSALRADNLDRATLVGVELDLALGAGPVTTRASYTALATKNDGDSALARGKPLPGRPAHDFALDSSLALGPAKLRYALDVVAGTTLDPNGTIVLPMRALHGAGASLEVPGVPGLVVGAQVDNLLDTRVAYVASPVTGHKVAEPVSDMLAYPLPGRTVWGTVKVVVR